MGRTGLIKQFQLTQTIQQNAYTLTAEGSKRNYHDNNDTQESFKAGNVTGIILPNVQQRNRTDMRVGTKKVSNFSQINPLSKRSNRIESDVNLA